MADTSLLWASQGIYVLLVILNTWLWGTAINGLGQFQMSLSFVWRLGTNLYFVLAMLTALSATVVTYYARASLGFAKGSLFYSLGTVALVLTSYYLLHERFTFTQGAGIALIMVGVVLLS